MEWIDRQWTFDDSAEINTQHVFILNATADQFKFIIENRTSDHLRHKPGGKWSIHEQAGHVLPIESLWIARLDNIVMKSETLWSWNGTNADTDAGNFNEQRIVKILEDFTDDRKVHTEMLWKMDDSASSLKCFHTRIGQPFTLADHVYTDWTSVIVQSLLRQIELNTCIHRHLPLYDFSNIGLIYKSHWYYFMAQYDLHDLQIIQHQLNAK